VETVAAAGLVGRRAEEERTFGFCTAGLARTSRGASMVTGGSTACAFAIEGIAESALQSTSILALLKAR
jgi:hypothetical protein